MSARDVAQAIRRLDSAAARRALLSGDKYVFANLSLDDHEIELLIEECELAVHGGEDRLAQPCIDPELKDTTQKGAFFDAAKYALGGMEREVADFQEFLAQQAIDYQS